MAPLHELALSGRITRPLEVKRPYALSAPVFWPTGVESGGSRSSRDGCRNRFTVASAAAVLVGLGARRRFCTSTSRQQHLPSPRRAKRRAPPEDDFDGFDEMDEMDDEMEFDDDEYNENRIMPPPKSLNRMDEDWDTDDGQFAMGFEDDMEDEDLENMDNIEAMDMEGVMGFGDEDMEDMEAMDGSMDDWDDEGFSMPYSEEDGPPAEGDFVGSVFDGMDGPRSGPKSSSIPSYEELSLLYDDFPVQGEEKPVPQPDVALKERSEQSKTNRSGRTLEYMEEREYQVTAEGIAIRTLPDERSPRTGEILREGEKFTAIEAVDGIDNDPRLYLRLPDGRGWVFNDEKIYPGMPSVKLISEIKSEKVQPEVIKKPLIAVVGRPNVGKSTLVNRICDIADVIGGITHDEVNVTHDRTYKPAEHTDDCGNTYLFDTIDAGGLVFEDSLETVTFKNEIKFQIDVALREAAAAIMVVDGNVGVTEDDYKVARYLKETYISRGLRVVLAVAKCDRLETMDIKAAEFWQLGLGTPIPISAYHRRGTWEVVDALINKGCNGLFPMRSKDQKQVVEPRDNAIKVAICGKPNAGKSSLFNALVGEDRTIVSDIPGSTTDSVDAYLEAYNGNIYRFIDTAGIKKKNRIQTDTQWLSVNRSMKAINRADVALLVLDASEIMTNHRKLGMAFWCPDIQMRYIARAIEERGTAAVIVLTKWDAVPNKDAKSQERFIQAIRSNLGGVGQWAEVVACSAKTGQRISKVIDAVDKTLAAHRKRIPTNVLNEVIRDALLWKLPPAKAYNSKQGRIYYATQTAIEPPQLVLFCNNPKLFGPNYKIYLENKIRQDLGWFGTPFQIEYRKRTEKRAVSQAEQWLGPRLQASEAWR